MAAKVCDINTTLCHFSHCGHTGLCDFDIYSIILTTLARQSCTFARVSHDSRETFVRLSHDFTTVVRHSRECLTTVVRYSCERLTTVVRHSFECLTMFTCDFGSVLFLAIKSRNGLIYVAYLSHYANREHFLAICLRTSVKGWRRVCDGFATYAMTWRWFCDDFCRTKKYYMFKTLANRSRRVRDAWEVFVIPCERFATVRDGLANRFASPARTRRIPVRTEELCSLICTFVFIYVYDSFLNVNCFNKIRIQRKKISFEKNI